MLYVSFVRDINTDTWPHSLQLVVSILNKRKRHVTTYIIILAFLSESEKGVNRSITSRGTVGYLFCYRETW